MKEFKLELTGMTCDSCTKLIKMVAEQNEAVVTAVDFEKHSVTVACEPEKLDKLKQELAEKGYPEKGKEGGTRGNPERVKKYISAIVAGEPHVAVETNLLNYAVGSMAVLTVLGGIAYVTILKDLANVSAYAPLLLLTIIGAVVTVYSYYHMKCYRKAISCMNGMMVGMTMGMITGFMVGALIGATNGIFIGSTAGIIVGMALGGNIGRCCGVMGAMEGIMAGLMAGIMGAMTSIMMLRDNLVLFLYILFGVCAFLLTGLSYLMYRESGAAPKVEFKYNFTDFLSTAATFAILIAAMMLYGPKGLLIYP